MWVCTSMCKGLTNGVRNFLLCVVAVDSKRDRPAEDTELSGCKPQPRDQAPARGDGQPAAPLHGVMSCVMWCHFMWYITVAMICHDIMWLLPCVLRCHMMSCNATDVIPDWFTIWTFVHITYTSYYLSTHSHPSLCSWICRVLRASHSTRPSWMDRQSPSSTISNHASPRVSATTTWRWWLWAGQERERQPCCTICSNRSTHQPSRRI